MAPVIWGLDLKEMQWGKFKGSYMFNREYHLRRSKMIVYQIAMILCVCSESVGTAALSGQLMKRAPVSSKTLTGIISNSDYVKEQTLIERLHSSASVHNDDFVGIASYNIFVGIFVATIFGAGFFFDLFWPERHESKSVRLAWKICAVLACVMCLADALALTVIVARHSSTITADTADQLAIAKMAINPPLIYKHNARAVASVVLLWPGWVATVASTCILFASHFHDEVYGPKTAHVRRLEEKDVEARQATVGTSVSTSSPSEPSPTPPARQSTLSAYKSGRWNADR